MNWKNVFNTNHKHWGLDEAIAAAKEAGYPMICWNEGVYAVSEDGTIKLEKPLCLVEDLE